MQSPTLILNQFIQPVPVCPTDANLRVAVKKFHSSQSEVMVVVDEQLVPVGMLCLSHLLPYIQPTLLAKTTPGKDNGNQKRASSLMIPVVSLSAHLSLEELCQNLQHWQFSAGHHPRCVVVDHQGKFLGLLDTWGLLRYLLSSNLPTRETISPRQDNLGFKVSSEAPQPTPLVKLMEQLPLPLRLETNSRQIIFQNSTWCSQIGSREPSETNLSCSLITPEPAFSSLIKPLVEASSTRRILPEPDPNPMIELQPCCQTYRPMSDQGDLSVDGSFSNLELLETKIHQERTWQFVRIPISLPMGSPVPSQENASRITQNQSPGWLVMATDVTEQEKLCKELAAKNADLVQLNRLKDEFLACISHELKSPLTAVVGLSSLLKDESLGKLNQRQARYANLIYQSGHHLMTLVNDILDLTRLETGQLQLTLEPLKLQSVCERAYQQALQLQSFREQNKEAWEENKFTLEIEPGLDLMVADEMRLRQMLVHLLDNALKFTEASGEIGLQVSNWEGWIAFTIWDTGVGIPPALQHLIFQKFQQLENPLTRRFEGTGLGLVLTQRLARAHGGDISFTSKVGQGSQFTLLLPPSPPQEHNHNQDSSQEPLEDSWQEILLHQPATTTNRLVLVVEAVPRYIEDLTGQLRELGYRVVIARSGTEALEKARRLQPRVILLNPLLPLLSGWDVLVLLKSDAKTSQIPILVTSTRGEKQRAEQNGADGFLCLPVEKADLNSSLKCLGEPVSAQSKRLTILRLRETTTKSSLHALDLALSSQSSPLNYRILEAQDVEQADVIARVWHPDVVLLDGENLSNPLEYLQNLSQQPALAALPLVTFDAKTTQAANQFPNITAFPCLVDSGQESLEALLEVIQVASGIGSQSHVLVYGNWEKTYSEQEKINSGQSKSTGVYEWLQALVHYLQTAGLRSSLSNSWREVYSQIQYRSLDLLLLYVENRDDYGSFVRQLQPLAKMENKPTILVFDHRCLSGKSDSNEQDKLLNQLLEEIATTVFQAHTYSMSDLLAQINRMVSH